MNVLCVFRNCPYCLRTKIGVLLSEIPVVRRPNTIDLYLNSQAKIFWHNDPAPKVPQIVIDTPCVRKRFGKNYLSEGNRILISSSRINFNKLMLESILGEE